MRGAGFALGARVSKGQRRVPGAAQGRYPSMRSTPSARNIYRIKCLNAFVPSDICVITVSTEQFNTLAMSSREHLKRYASSNITRCSVGRCASASAIRVLRSAGASVRREGAKSLRIGSPTMQAVLTSQAGAYISRFSNLTPMPLRPSESRRLACHSADGRRVPQFHSVTPASFSS
jgi:hypothetical protein